MLEYEHLAGKQFEMGRQDCFRLAIDFFRDNYGIEITNYARPSDWSADTLDLMALLHERERFHKLEGWTLKTLRPGDVLCMAIGSRNANHFAIYVGENKIIHHIAHRMSEVETLRDFWRGCTCYVLRHEDVPYTEVVKPSVQLQEIINARYSVKASQEAEG